MRTEDVENVLAGEKKKLGKGKTPQKILAGRNLRIIESSSLVLLSCYKKIPISGIAGYRDLCSGYN
jgi:hypothetical protein